MKIALVFPPYKHKIFSENISPVDEEFCLAPPIILAYVAAIVEQHGHKVKLIDARALNLSKEETLAELKLFKPDLLGFRAESYYFHDALEWMRYLRKNLSVPVMAGGINLSLYPKETMSHSEIDYGIIGEALKTLPQFLSAMENGDSLCGIHGLAYKKDRAVILNPEPDELIDFDDYPFPARHLLKNDAYYSFVSQLRSFTIMLASTGCPFRCSFCAIHPNTVYRTRSPKNVVDEIEMCYRDFSIKEIDFFDAVFFLQKNRLREIFNEIKKRRLKIEWSCRARVDVVDPDILKEASEAGCRQIYYGIESVDPDVLSAIRKDVRKEQIKDAIKWSRRQGIRTMGFFMVGNPGDTEDTVRKTIDFSKDLGLDFVQVCRTIAKPGTELDKMVIEYTDRDLWREHVSGKRIESRLPMPWSSLSEVEIESLTREFYIKFYFRPNVILRRMCQAKSSGEVMRYIKVALKMFLQKSELYSNILTDTVEAEKVLRQSPRYLKDAREKKVAVVMPTYNEKDNIQGMAKAILEVLPQAYLVIVDDNSPDGTAAIAEGLLRENPNMHIIRRTGVRGLGLAYIDGFKFVLGNLDSEYIFEIDADFSHNPGYLPVFLHHAEKYKLVTGSRFLRHVSIKNRVIWRNMLSIYSKRIVNLLIGMNLSDVATGFKCFHRSVLEDIDFNSIKSKGYAFQIETSYKAQRKGVCIKEIPILFEERRSGASKMSYKIILEGLFMVFYLTYLRIFRREKRVKPDFDYIIDEGNSII